MKRKHIFPSATHALAALAALWALVGVSCAASDSELLQRVQAVGVQQMGVFTTPEGETYVAMVVEVSNSSPQRILIETADLALSLKREEIVGVLPELELDFSYAIVNEPQALAPSGATSPSRSFLRVLVPIGDADDPGTIRTLTEMFNLLAADRWHQNPEVREKFAGKRVLLKLSGDVTARIGDESASETSDRRIDLQLELAPSRGPVFVSKP